MPLTQRKSSIADPDAWLPIDRAARLIGAHLRSVQRWAKNAWCVKGLAELRPPRSDRGKPVWWIHRTAHARLVRFASAHASDENVRETLTVRYGQRRVERVYRKTHWLKEWRSRCERPRTAGETDRSLARKIVAEAKRVEGDRFRISVRSLQMWWNASRRLDDSGRIMGARALVDGYTDPAAPATGDGDGGGSVPPTANRSAEAIEYFYKLYHTTNMLSVKKCHILTRRLANAVGWSWPASYRAAVAWLTNHDDLSLSCLMRDGHDIWARRFLPHNEIDYNGIDPGEMFVCDHHQCDFWVDYNGKQLRPWLTAVQDLRSRCIVGWNLGASPHQDAILSSTRMAFRDRSIPEVMRIDNGRDYTSELLTGVTKHTRDRLRSEHGVDWRRALKREAESVECVDPRFLGVVHELGIELIYAIPYAPWSKGTLERWFRTFEDECGKTFATYCGNSTLKKPECLETIRRGYTKEKKRYYRKRYGTSWKKVSVLRLVDQSAVPTLDAAREAVAGSIELYHHTQHSADDMNGLTPRAMWNTATHLRRAAENELLFLMQSRGVYRVGPNGVRLKVGSATIGYGADAPALYRLRGRDVFITLDPDEASCCFAWTADRDKRRFLGRLAANQRISPRAGVDELREASAAIGRRRKTAAKARRDGHKRTRSVAQELAAQRRARLAELRATGTDDAGATPNIVPVRTPFEGASIPRYGSIESDPPSDYDDIDLSALDLSSPDDADEPHDEYSDIDLNGVTFDSSTEDDDPYSDIDLNDMELS